jgi:hypothetical protein
MRLERLLQLLRLLLRFLLICGGYPAFVCSRAGDVLLQSALLFLVLFGLCLALSGGLIMSKSGTVSPRRVKARSSHGK